MKKLSLKDYEEIRSWMYRNARQIELELWRYSFENGSREAVLSALAFYQNDDGGFGHALEPDSWNPASSPYATLRAGGILKAVGFNDKRHPIMQGIFKFLGSGAWCLENGWYFNIPSNNDHAHAPWWTYDREANLVESIGLTAHIAAFIFMNADKASAIYDKALALSDLLFGKLGKMEKYGDMGIGGYCALLDGIERAGLSRRFDCSSLAEKIKRLVYDSIERDTSKWAHYSTRPSQYIYSPESSFYRDNEDIVAKELDYLIDTRPGNGVWDITWSWFENNGKYPKEFAISENWWKADQAIAKLNFLKSFGRLEEG